MKFGIHGIAIVLASAAAAASAAEPLPRGFVEVRPVVRSAGPPVAPLSLGSTPFFTYAMPPGWRIGENGQYALTLLAPDMRALTLLAGNSGLAINTPPAQFAYQKLMGIQPQGLQLSQPRMAKPLQGFAQAYEFQVMYSVNGVPCRGVATVHVAPAYDSAVMALTAALSDARQWQGYSAWLPLVASQVAARNGAAFGVRGMMVQNIENSTAFGEALREHRAWSQKLQEDTAKQRGDSIDRRNQEFRDTVGNVQPYSNPYDTRAPVELPNTYQHFWVNERGTIVGTNDPGVNPNDGSTHDWRKMPKQAR